MKNEKFSHPQPKSTLDRIQSRDMSDSSFENS